MEGTCVCCQLEDQEGKINIKGRKGEIESKIKCNSLNLLVGKLVEKVSLSSDRLELCVHVLAQCLQLHCNSLVDLMYHCGV